jgi:hypothetical protein
VRPREQTNAALLLRAASASVTAVEETTVSASVSASDEPLRARARHTPTLPRELSGRHTSAADAPSVATARWSLVALATTSLAPGADQPVGSTLHVVISALVVSR